MNRRILSVLLCLMLLSTLAMMAYAVEVPDMDRKGSISIAMTYKGEAVPGGSLTLYRVAQVHVENGADYSFRYIQDYAECPASLDQIDDPKTAQAIADYTESNRISGTKVQIDDQGKITFQDLELGLYLLIQQDAAEGYELVNPFLVSVPSAKNGSYTYHVDASPKLALERVPTQTTEPTEPSEPSEPTTPPDLPQTGQNQWPVPVMAISGLVFVVIGLMFYVSGKKKAYES